MKQIYWNGWTEVKKKVVSARMGSVFFLVIALVCALATGIDAFMVDKQEWITPWMAPHFFNNKFFVTFYGFIVCYMYSEVPFMNRSEMNFLLRKGRIVWCMEKVFAIIIQASVLALFTFIMSVLIFIPHIQFDMKWGKVIHTLAFSNNMWNYNIIGNASPVIIGKYEPLEAMFVCFIIVWMVTSLMGVLMFVLSLYGNRLTAVAVTVVMTGLTLAEGNFITTTWLPYLTPFNWCRLGLHGQPIFLDYFYPPLKVYLCLVFGGLFVLVLAVIWKSRHIEYVWNKEE